MSYFICAHGLLTSSCIYCNEFDKPENDDDDYSEETTEEEITLRTIVRSIKKEKIEY